MYTIYILLCSDNTLYTGITNDLDSRLAKHQAGIGAKYTRGRSPVRLIYSETAASKSDALKREIEIKSWSRADKISKLSLKV